MLDTLCQAHLWDEALVELDRLAAERLVDTETEEHFRLALLVELGRFEDVLRLAGSDDGAAHALALAGLKRTDDALAMARRLVVARSRNAERTLARVLEAAGDDEQALLWFERASRRTGASPDNRRDAAQALMRLEDWGEAAAAWQGALRMGPFVWPEDLDQLAECLDHTGRPIHAEEARSLAETYREMDGASDRSDADRESR